MSKDGHSGFLQKGCSAKQMKFLWILSKCTKGNNWIDLKPQTQNFLSIYRRRDIYEEYCLVNEGYNNTTKKMLFWRQVFCVWMNWKLNWILISSSRSRGEKEEEWWWKLEALLRKYSMPLGSTQCTMFPSVQFIGEKWHGGSKDVKVFKALEVSKIPSKIQAGAC